MTVACEYWFSIGLYCGPELIGGCVGRSSWGPGRLGREFDGGGTGFDGGALAAGRVVLFQGGSGCAAAWGGVGRRRVGRLRSERS